MTAVPLATSNARVPFGRIFAFGERGGVGIILAGILISSGVHGGLAAAAGISSVTILTADPGCHVGDTIQLEGVAKTRWGGMQRVTGSGKWSSSDASILQPVDDGAGGFFRCIAQGTAEVHTAYGGKTSDVVRVQVEAAVVMIDEEIKPKESEPEPEVAPVAQSPSAPPTAMPTPDKAPPPPAAKVGHLLTAPDDPGAQKSDDPTSFLSDPNGKEYGSGTVAIGGTADHAGPGAAASGVAGGTGSGLAAKGPPAVAAPPITLADLSRRPQLPGGADACKGYFPADADDDSALVQISVKLKASGDVESATVVSEDPKGQGFGKAGRNCLTGKRFLPALDKSGNAVPFTTPVIIRFTR